MVGMTQQGLAVLNPCDASYPDRALLTRLRTTVSSISVDAHAAFSQMETRQRVSLGGTKFGSFRVPPVSILNKSFLKGLKCTEKPYLPKYYGLLHSPYTNVHSNPRIRRVLLKGKSIYILLLGILS